MSEIIEDRRSGIGAIYETGPSNDLDGEYILFADQAAELIDIAQAQGSCLVEGIPGAGKTHLVNDIRRAIWQADKPALILKAHISGGTKKGGPNATYMMDVFTEQHGKDGVIVIDNIDYFGYSGRKNKRSYSLAQAQLVAANKIIELATDSSAPIVVGLAHTDEWRQAHWRFGQRRGSNGDEVTPAAQDLLDSFGEPQEFKGTIGSDTAMTILQDRFPSAAPGIIASTVEIIGRITSKLYFRHINHLPAVTGYESDIRSAIESVDVSTAQLLGRLTLVEEDEL